MGDLKTTGRTGHLCVGDGPCEQEAFSEGQAAFEQSGKVCRAPGLLGDDPRLSSAPQLRFSPCRGSLASGREDSVVHALIPQMCSVLVPVQAQGVWCRDTQIPTSRLWLIHYGCGWVTEAALGA